jgi:hypothetical protein
MRSIRLALQPTWSLSMPSNAAASALSHHSRFRARAAMRGLLSALAYEGKAAHDRARM